MVARQSNAQERKDVVLGIVVHEYIKTIAPVGSAHMVKQYGLNVSPATVRNTLSELEQDGYLTHPHTSAGRVPTEKGYRYYVDFLMKEIRLLEEEQLRLKYEHKRGLNELENLLENMSMNLSDVTQCTSIVSFDEWGSKIICRGTNYMIQQDMHQDLERVRSLLRMLEEKEQMLEIINRDLKQKIDIFIGQELALKEMEHCSLAVSEFTDQRGRKGRVAILGPTRMDYDRVVAALNHVTETMNKMLGQM